RADAHFPARIRLPAKELAFGRRAAGGERTHAQPGHRRRCRHLFGRRLRTGDLGTTLARGPDRAPAVDRACCDARAATFGAGAHARHDAGNLNANGRRAAREVAVAELTALARAPTERDAVGTNGAAVRSPRAQLRPGERRRHLYRSGAGDRGATQLPRGVRAPAIQLVAKSDAA